MLVTGTTQRGSLPAYLGTILVVVLALPGTVLLTRAPWPGEWRAWDTPVQALVGAVVLIAAALALRIRQRLSAVLVVGVTGYGVAVLFALQGAPDLALTQFLVETLTLVVFVLVLRKLPKDITERHRPRERAVRGVIAVAVGALMGAVGAVALAARTATPVSAGFPEPAYDFGGGKNIVNVTLVDIRAWDTLGEISLLVVAATGVASLVFLRGRTGGVDRRGRRRARRAGRRRRPGAAAPLAGRVRARSTPERRSVVLEVVTRILFHTILVFSLYLLFSGHNAPGGGFAGGLVAGLALVLRYLAGGRYELGEAAPVDPGLLLGAGLLFAGGTGVAGLLLGAEVLQTAILETTLPVLGDVKLVTSLFFDIGVYLIVVGLVLDVLRSLGAELDRQEDEDDPIEARARRGGRPMTPTVVLPVLIGGLYAAGVYLLLDRSLTRVLVGFLLLGNATNLLLLSAGGPAGRRADPRRHRAGGDERPAAAGADPHRDRDHLRRRRVPAGDDPPVLAAGPRGGVGTDEEDRRVAGRHGHRRRRARPRRPRPGRPAGRARGQPARAAGRAPTHRSPTTSDLPAAGDDR